MKIGLFAPLLSPAATPEFLDTIGRTAEECGFCSIWLAEHVVLFDDYASHYPYADDHRIPAGGENGFLDPFPALAFLAARTESIRLGTGICLVPQRNPVYTAKEVTSVDWLSGGRLDFGVGVGWLAEEYAALEAPFERRGDVEIAISPYMKGCDADKLARYRDAGVDQVIVPGFALEVDAMRALIEDLAETLVVPARSL